MALATLYGPNGQKQVVTVGSGQASQLQSQGWGLNAGSYKAAPPKPASGGYNNAPSPYSMTPPAQPKPAMSNPYNKISNPYSSNGMSMAPINSYNKMSDPYKSASTPAPSTPTIPQVASYQTSTPPLSPQPTPMVFSPEQTSGLIAAYKRVASGGGNDADKRNLEYAMSRGFNPYESGGSYSPAVPEANQGSLTPPPAPEISPEDQAVIDAKKAYEAAIPVTAEELKAKEDLDNLNQSYKTAYQNTGGQVIPLDFITGQQKSLEERKLGLEEPLAARLARMQAQRQSTLEASKFALERADAAAAAAKAARKPVSVSSGETLIDPTTGKVIYSSEAKSDNPTSYREWQLAGSPGDYQSWLQQSNAGKDIIKINGIDYQRNADGSLSIPNTPDPQSSITQRQAAQSAKDLLAMFNSGKGKSAVGFSSLFGTSLIPGSAASDFVRQFDNLKSLLSLDNVKLLKGQGAVSDAERKLLADASTKLDRRQSESEFKKTLESVVRVLGNINFNSNNAANGGFNW